MNRQKGRVIWLMGLSGSGKSTLADALAETLGHSGQHRIYRLDGDTLRDGLNSDLGFKQQDRDENLRRAAHVARLFAEEGYVVIASFISPLESQRQMVRAQFDPDQYCEVWLSTPLSVCEQRDPKGLYRKARQGLIPEFTGIDSAFETPECCDLMLNTATQAVSDSVLELVRELKL